MNEKKRWNVIAPTYNDEIFDVFRSDKLKKLPRYFKKHANPQHSAIDFGCGNGKAFSYLAPKFKHVLGLDISQGLLDQARALGYPNVSLQQKDLAVPNLRLPKAEFAFCCNVAILSDVEMNHRLIKNVQKSLKPKGNAVFVIPSMESVLLSGWRLIDWYKKEGVHPKDIDADEISSFKSKKHEILQGLININGVLTKHYSEPEIEIVFAKAGFTITSIEKIEYDWNSEFSKPPTWMKAPFPWDWLVECTV
jgi:SAM-dependent methyltransferase